MEDGRQGQGEWRTGLASAQFRCCQGFQALLARPLPPEPWATALRNIFFRFLLLGSRRDEGTQRGSRIAGWESMQGLFHSFRKKSFSRMPLAERLEAENRG